MKVGNKTFIYMNDHIREPAPTDPVIAVFRNGKTVYTNEVAIHDARGKIVARVVFRRNGLRGAGHHVKAWIETEAHVEVLA